MQASLTFPRNATLISGDNPVYIGNVNRGESRTVNWTLVFIACGVFNLDVNASGYRKDTGGYVENHGFATVTVVDTTPPTIPILSPQNTTYPTGYVSLVFTVNETTDWMGYCLDGQANVTITGNTTISNLSEGAHYVIVYGNDTAGNMGESSIIHFAIDTTLPTISIVSPKNKTYVIADIPLTFTVDETASWFGYSLDGQMNVTITGNTTLTDLPDGAHFLKVYVNDTCGNMGLGEICFTVDLWNTVFIGLGGYPIVDFAVYNDKLYAASDNTLYMYNGTSWTIIDTPTYVLSLEPCEEKLIVGGKNGLYSYNGTTFTLIFAISSYIKPLGVYNNSLYAGTVLDKPPTLYYCNGSVENPDNWCIDTAFSTILSFPSHFGSIDSFAEYSDNMYVTSGGTVYSYDGTRWNITKTYGDVYAYLDTKVYDGKLYLATRDQAWRKPVYQGYSGFSGRVLEFDGSSWTTVFDHDYWMYSLETYAGKLYAGTADRIYTYNGTDWKVSFHSEETCHAISLITFNNTIYAGMGNGYILTDPSIERANPKTTVIPELPSVMLMPLFMIVTLMTALIYRRKHTI